MGKLKYAVHAYAWTGSWSNATLDLIDRAKALGFDMIEVPLMEIDLVDSQAVKKRLSRDGSPTWSSVESEVSTGQA